jgi:hypothetical protein
MTTKTIQVLLLAQKGVWEEDARSKNMIDSFFSDAQKVSKAVVEAKQSLLIKSDVQPGKYNYTY